MICEIRILDAPYAIDRPFDYAIPDSLAETVRRGAFVKVPFGAANRLRLGVVTDVKGEDASDTRTKKPVHSVLDDTFCLSEEMLGLCLFIKNYTLSTYGEAVKCILPPGALADRLNVKTRKTYRLTVGGEEVTRLLSSEKGSLRSEGQRTVLRYLAPIGEADETLVRALPGVDSTHILALVKKGILAFTETEDIRNPYSSYAKVQDNSPILLSPAQQTAYAALEELLLADGARAALLYGVTGSGKTKVIMKAIDRTIGEGKRVIMLVPEIALTPQTVGIFCRRYGDRVAVIHSSLSQGERLDAFRRIKRGQIDLVIGTRSAVFAPVPDLGMIVIDEEHEHTYKSEQNPKYHARDVAAYRCGKNNALMLLASATPSLESYHKTETGQYTLIPLLERYGGLPLPKAYVVDMREELRLGNMTPISRRLYEALEGAEEEEKQAILFLNRRGYNSQISCRSCGEVLACPRCSVSLTYHTGEGGGKCMCHLCGYTQKVPRTCPSCGAEDLSFLGFGTQKVEAELGKTLPDMRVMRMDADTTGEKLAYDRMLEDFRAGRADILLGTQMVTKGHDFPRVSLVGVVLADTSLYISDFRAAERTFSLLTQVIGRAGRAGSGTAVIQTYSPDNEVIRLACAQDYTAFYRGEIALRRSLGLPPFCDMITLTVTSEDEDLLMRTVTELRRSLDGRAADFPEGQRFVLDGPFEAPVYKMNDVYRMRFVFRWKLNNKTRAFFHELLMAYASKKNINLTVDLNPLTV